MLNAPISIGTQKQRQHSLAESISLRPARSRLQPQASDISVALSEIVAETNQHSSGFPREQELLLSFRGNNHKGIKNSVIQRLQEDSFCNDALILRRCPGDQFRVFSTNEASDNTLYSTKAFPGISDVLLKRVPVVLDQHFNPWKALFYHKPKTLILIPINIYRVRPKRELMIECITVLAYNADPLPVQLTDESVLNTIFAFCNFTAPLLFNVQRFEDAQQEFINISGTFESYRDIVKEIQDLSSCINTIGLDCFTLFQARHAVVFLIVDEPHDARLLKYCSFGGGKVQDVCPQRLCHTVEELPQQTNFPAGWAALHKKCIRANDPADLAAQCGAIDVIHSIGGCVVPNIMCFVIDDLSNDMSLLVELSEKSEGFTEEDELKAITFSKRISPMLTSAVLLDYRKRAVRRSEITNKVISNIKQVAVRKVQHLLDFKFNFSNTFRRQFLNYRFIVRRLDPSKLPSILLYMFTELKFIDRWKMRRVTLIRFILSIKQGYRDNPYHNWRHACNSAHFAFILLKQAALQKEKFLTDLEALALLVSCICHDIDHRGLNSRFLSAFHMEETPSTYSLYTQEDGLVQRQHLTLTLQILSSDDCNIVENMTDEEYREFIELVQLCITATDIGHYLQNREKLFESLKTFDKKSSAKRRSLLAVLMTVCDLSETVKPWDEYLITVKNIFSEFFTQGDQELKLGVTPKPTMNRRIAYIPLIELQFINEVVRPAYDALTNIVPKVEECLHKIDYFKELWLVSTKIFEDFVRVHNPLDILSQVEMSEEHLKNLNHPELEKHVHHIRKSLGQGGSSNFSLSVLSSTFLNTTKSMEFNSISFHATDPAKSVISLGIIPKTKTGSCCQRLKSKCCRVLRCQHHALDDASVLRRFNQEDAFMQEQSHMYERRRSNDSGDMDNISMFRATL